MKGGPFIFILCSVFWTHNFVFASTSKRVQLNAAPVAYFAAGITNISLQVSVDESSAFLVDYAKLKQDQSNRDEQLKGLGRSFSYKAYSGIYGKSSFWRLGVARIEVESESKYADRILPVLLWGTELTGQRFLFGSEFGFGAYGGLGYANFYIGTRF